MKTRAIIIAAITAAVATSIIIYNQLSKFEKTPADGTGSKPVKREYFRKAPPGEKYVVIDRYSNKLYLRTGEKVLMTANCSTGSGIILKDKSSKRQWKFETPAGMFAVSNKLVEPWWRKPDWAFIEENLPTPEDDRERLDPEMLGEYAIGFGDGYYIHGTIYEDLLGVSVTHGCVRLGSDDLERLYRNVSNGTRIFIY